MLLVYRRDFKELQQAANLEIESEKQFKQKEKIVKHLVSGKFNVGVMDVRTSSHLVVSYFNYEGVILMTYQQLQPICLRIKVPIKL